MTNQLFPDGREGFLDGSIDWDTATIKASLLRGYSFNSSHRFVSDVTGAGGVLVATQTLGTKTVTDGVADAGDITFPAVAPGSSIPHLFIYQASAPGGGVDVDPTSQRAIALIDTATGLPVIPNGGDVNVVWSNGADRIFRL